MAASATSLSSVDFDRLAELLRRPDLRSFQALFDASHERQLTQAERIRLKELGTEALEVALDVPALPDSALLQWFASHLSLEHLETTTRIAELLAAWERKLRAEAERRRYGGFDRSTTVVQTRRVVQLSWFGLSGWQSSDAFEIRRSVFRSSQERSFMQALQERFPHLRALPNYPLDQIADLSRLRPLVGDRVWRYGLRCRLDFLLVTPREGDPVAAFELDSQAHDAPERQERDDWRNRLLELANVQLFRLRSEDPQATTPDEWYQLLTTEVVGKLNVGERMRNRDVHPTLVPLVR